MNNIIPFEEVFYGTNNVLYKHTYYIAKIKNSEKIITIDHNCLEQIREVRALQWFDIDDVQNHINVHNIERHQIISKINDILLKNVLKI